MTRFRVMSCNVSLRNCATISTEDVEKPGDIHLRQIESAVMRVHSLSLMILSAGLSLILVERVSGQETAKPDPAKLEFFEKKVRPLLVNNCYNCHSADNKAAGGLRVDDHRGLLQGGGRGKAIKVGNPEESLLIKAVSHTDAKLKMPPNNQLADEQIDILKQWIKDGAVWPALEVPAELHAKRPEYDQLLKEHWAWQPLHKVNPPTVGGAVNYGSAFLPAHFQGTRINDSGFLPNLKAEVASPLQRRQIELVQEMNRDLRAAPGAPSEIDGVIESYELAFRMQGKVPELLDISREPKSVLDAYGVKPGPAGSFARQCVLARRLSEAGVRFVQIRQGGWDHHNNLNKGLISNAAATDQPTAALLADLEQRGLLDETLVLFGSEFGRLPTAQGPDGRDHNITGYPMWLAGAGVKPGFSYGATDEYGTHAVEGRMHTMDLHATLLALMGLDHELLTYRYAGRDFRLTDVGGNVVREIFA